MGLGCTTFICRILVFVLFLFRPFLYCLFFCKSLFFLLVLALCYSLGYPLMKRSLRVAPLAVICRHNLAVEEHILDGMVCLFRSVQFHVSCGCCLTFYGLCRADSLFLCVVFLFPSPSFCSWIMHQGMMGTEV